MYFLVAKHTFRVSFALHKRNTHKRKYYTSTKYDCTHNIAFYSKKQSANNRASFFAQSERQILYKKRASVQKERTCLLHFFYASWQSFYTPECRKLSLPWARKSKCRIASHTFHWHSPHRHGEAKSGRKRPREQTNRAKRLIYRILCVTLQKS